MISVEVLETYVYGKVVDSMPNVALRSLVKELAKMALDRSPELGDAEIVEKANVLCKRFASVFGWETKGGHPKFQHSDHPRRQQMWELARVAFEELMGTDIDDAVTASSEESA